MSLRHRLMAASLTMCVVVAACSTESPSPLSPDVFLAKSGTSTGGGGGGGGGTDTSTTTSPTSGPPVAPSYIAKITKMGVVPGGFYYGSPTDWEIGGYHFAAGYVTNYKAVNGPIALGACVSVTFYDIPGDRFMTELKTLSSSKCP